MKYMILPVARVLLTPGVPLPPPTPEEDAIRIGLIDSGVLAEHPQLRTLIVAEKAFVGADPTDRIGHGTLMALPDIKWVRIHGVAIFD